MKKLALCFIPIFLLAVAATAQDVKLPVNVEKLSAKAVETVDVSMEGPVLQWASRFLSSSDPEEAQARKFVANLKGIYVRSFEFASEGEYSHDDVDAVRSQLRPPVWSKMVGVRSKKDGDNVDVFFRFENNQMTGLVVIAAERKELTFVNIDGPINPEELANLGGEFGIPKLDMKDARIQKGAGK